MRRAVDQFAWSNTALELFGCSTGPGWKHHDIRFVAIQRAESSIANTAVANDAAILQFEIADVCELLLLGVSDEREQERSTDYTDCFLTFGRPHCPLRPCRYVECIDRNRR